ncbi:uncharacterized protein LOC141911628 [Tubulanus polymorphus]|uniref:uncharacterized protein LOC141911628 n=1 Tax=Tubulanus polymorphus TaxID=672921 RepID=UPI003DA3783C
MDEEERQRKLKAGKERLAEFTKRKNRRKKKSKKSSAPDDGTDCSSRSERLDSAASAGISERPNSAASAGSSDFSTDSLHSLSYEDSDQGSFLASDEFSADDSTVNISFDAHIELKNAAEHITQLEEMLQGKQTALDELIAENQLLKSVQKTDVAAGDNDDMRDAVIEQLSRDLQGATLSRDDLQVEYTCQVDQLTQQIHLLQQQLHQAASNLIGQTDKGNDWSNALNGAKQQLVHLQTVSREKDAALRLLATRYSQKSDEYLEILAENEKLRDSDIEQRDRIQRITNQLEKQNPDSKQDGRCVQSDETVPQNICGSCQNCAIFEKENSTLKQRLEELKSILPINGPPGGPSPQIEETSGPPGGPLPRTEETGGPLGGPPTGSEEGDINNDQTVAMAAMREHKNIVEKLTAENRNHLKRIDEFKLELNEKSQQCERLESELLRMRSDMNRIEEIVADHEALKIRNDELKLEISKLNESRVEISEINDVFGRDFARISSEFATSRKRVDELSSDKTELLNCVGELTNRNTELAKRIDALTDQNAADDELGNVSRERAV